MADIKLFVCCHRPEQKVASNPLLLPVQVGAALAQSHFPGFLYDDTGENISGKNRSYCELTAQYWAWKNIDADYYGFFHYRRYLYPEQGERSPYRLVRRLDNAALDKLNYPAFPALMEGFDCVVPIGEDVRLPVRQHYARAPFHHSKDLLTAEQVIREGYPDYVSSMERYFSNSICYFGNIFVMSRELFHHYAQWLFSILEEFDRRTDLTAYQGQALRVDGYLGERLLGVYVTKLREDGKYRILELPRAHCVPELSGYLLARFRNSLLPPGSRRRAAVKGIFTR